MERESGKWGKDSVNYSHMIASTDTYTQIHTRKHTQAHTPPPHTHIYIEILTTIISGSQHFVV